jgi:hypothetical protein
MYGELFCLMAVDSNGMETVLERIGLNSTADAFSFSGGGRFSEGGIGLDWEMRECGGWMAEDEKGGGWL